MALPPSFTNTVLNPAPASVTGFSTTGATGTWSYNTSEAEPFTRFTKDATGAAVGILWGAVAQITGAIGTVISTRLWVRSSNANSLILRNNATSMGVSYPLNANEWTEITVTGYAVTVADFRLGALITMAAAGTIDFKHGLVVAGATLPPYFDGAINGGGNYTSKWNGAANASTSTRDYYGIWAEQLGGAGAPMVQVTVIGLGGVAVSTQVIRQSGRDTWSVPGWKKRNTLGGETFTDATPPLGRPVTYTLISNGLTINSISLTVTSTTGWVQDPLSPETAMPVALTDENPAILALGKAALKRLTYGAQYEEETPLGGAYPIVRAEARSAASGLEFHLNAYQNVTSDALQQLVLDTPVLLFRGLPSWGSIPALAYLVGDVEEAPFNRDRGGQFTAWVAAGKLAAPVALGPLTGLITNAMVQDNLAGRTNASIQSVSGTKRNIDVQADPLSLGM
jgi:hypothetical protein